MSPPKGEGEGAVLPWSTNPLTASTNQSNLTLLDLLRSPPRSHCRKAISPPSHPNPSNLSQQPVNMSTQAVRTGPSPLLKCASESPSPSWVSPVMVRTLLVLVQYCARQHVRVLSQAHTRTRAVPTTTVSTDQANRLLYKLATCCQSALDHARYSTVRKSVLDWASISLGHLLHSKPCRSPWVPLSFSDSHSARHRQN